MTEKTPTVVLEKAAESTRAVEKPAESSTPTMVLDKATENCKVSMQIFENMKIWPGSVNFA